MIERSPIGSVDLFVLNQVSAPEPGMAEVAGLNRNADMQCKNADMCMKYADNQSINADVHNLNADSLVT